MRKRERGVNNSEMLGKTKRVKIDDHTVKSAVEFDTESEDVLSNIKIHPLLQMTNSTGYETTGGNDDNLGKKSKGKNVKHIVNPLKSDWKQREGFIVNPYIDQSDMSLVSERPRRALRFNEPGRQVERATLLREKTKSERLKREREEELKRLNLIPDENIGEEKYGDEFSVAPPYIEWWDEPFVKNRREGYDGGITYLDINSDDNPITSYIQHPVPIEAPWTRLVPEPKPLYLTKKEQKRLRKNRRMIAMQEKQDRIKLGLEATPGPKVKLKNLMNVLTNETIRNPTEVEMRVRREIQERADEHERMNQERKLNKEEKNMKLEKKFEEDRSKGIYCCIFNIKRLVNPKNVYKIDMNAKQLKLTGLCLTLNDKNSLIIVEGGNKSVEKYKHLLMNRINWEINEAPRKKGGDTNNDDNITLEDLSGNSCDIVWEGEIMENKFFKWTCYTFQQNVEIKQFLEKYHMDNYWQQVCLEN